MAESGRSGFGLIPRKTAASSTPKSALVETMIELLLNENRDLRSAFANALVGRRVNLDGEKGSEEVHLYTALATRWRKGSEAATLLLEEIRRLQMASASNKNYDDRTISEALKTLIYVATEAFDLYAQTIPKRLERGRNKTEVKLIREYERVVKRFRDPVALMCNRMKHDYREIVTGLFVSEATGETTFVYRINTTYGGVQLADRQIHSKVGFASFERTLHEIVHGLLRADFKAGELVDTLSDNCDLTIELKGPSALGLARVLNGLAETSPIVALSEPGQFDGIHLNGDKVVLTRVAAKKVPEPTKRTIRATVDEVARSIQVFTS